MMLLNRSNRWLILAAGAAIQILTGIPAAWGIFRRPVMAEYNLSRADVSAVFSLTIAWFGVATCRTQKAPAPPGFGAPPCLPSAWRRRALCPAGRLGCSAWGSACRLGWARPFSTRP